MTFCNELDGRKLISHVNGQKKISVADRLGSSGDVAQLATKAQSVLQ